MSQFSATILCMMVTSFSCAIYLPLLPMYQPYSLYESPSKGLVGDLPGDVDFICPEDGLFPDTEANCSAYYNCIGDQVERNFKM